MTLVINIHKALPQPSKEVVIVHAGRTTTSEQSLGVITNPKRKLITSETEIAHKQSPLAYSTTTVQTAAILIEEGIRA